MDKVIIGLPLAIGTACTKASAVDVDDIRIDRLHCLITKAKPLDTRHADIVDEYISVFQQRCEHGFIFRFFDVQVDGFFVAVERGEYRPVLLGRRIAAMAHQIARRIALAIFDLDDLSAQIGQLHRCIRPKHNRGHVDDLNALQRPGWFFVPCQFRPFRHLRSPYLLHRLLAYLSVQLRDNRE